MSSLRDNWIFTSASAICCNMPFWLKREEYEKSLVAYRYVVGKGGAFSEPIQIILNILLGHYKSQ